MNRQTRRARHVHLQAAMGLAIAALLIAPGCGGGGIEPTSTSCGRSGGTYVQPTPEPITLSLYVGTWKGPWPAASLIDEPDLKGEMTLTIDETGNVTGQITNTKTGQSGTLSGTITISNNVAMAALTTTFADQSRLASFTIQLRQYGEQSPEVLEGGLYVPNHVIIPGETPADETSPLPEWPNILFNLSRE